MIITRDQCTHRHSPCRGCGFLLIFLPTNHKSMIITRHQHKHRHSPCCGCGFLLIFLPTNHKSMIITRHQHKHRHSPCRGCGFLPDNRHLPCGVSKVFNLCWVKQTTLLLIHSSNAFSILKKKQTWPFLLAPICYSFLSLSTTEDVVTNNAK